MIKTAQINKRSTVYWTRRFEAQERAQLRKGLRFYNEMNQEYLKAAASIEREIRSWYSRYASATGMTTKDARKFLTSSERDVFAMSIEEYIEKGQKNALNQKYIRELEAASARAHISRLEALQTQMISEARLMYAKELNGLADLSKGIYATGYYHTGYVLQHGAGVGRTIQKLDPNKIEKVVSRPWTTDGKTFSTRIWEQQESLVGEMKTEISQMLMRGEAPDRAIANIAKKFNTSKANAGRLIMTESAYFASAGQKDCYGDLGVQEYEYVATLDEKTCEFCGGLDGKHMPMSEFLEGVTAPPLHAHCRCTTVPYFDDMDDWGATRLARDEEGQLYEVPAEMTYEGWMKEFVEKEAPTEATALLKINEDSNIYKKFGSTHYMAMHDIVENADESGRKVWAKYESQLTVTDSEYKGGAHYAPHGGVSLNVEKDSKGKFTVTGEMWGAPYQTSFHEFGHNIDYLSNAKNTHSNIYWYPFSYDYKDNIFGKTIVKDVTSHMSGIEKMLKSEFKLHGSDPEWLFKNNFISEFNFNWYKNNGELLQPVKYAKGYAYKYFENEIKALGELEKATVSDLVGGATKGRIKGGIGHSADYWKKNATNLPAEAFANMYSATMANGAELEKIKEFFPESYEIFLEILEEMVKE